MAMPRAYAVACHRTLGEELCGVYVYGSLAYGGWDAVTGDIDVTTLHRSDLGERQVTALGSMHEDLRERYPDAARLDVNYVPMHLVGEYGDPTLPYFRDGRWNASGGGDVNLVMWHSLRTYGIALWGPPASEFIPPVSPEALKENMRRNVAFLANRMPVYVSSGTAAQVFGVLTLCRVLYTYETNDVTSKVAAVRWALSRLDRAWHPVIERALVLYTRHVSNEDDLLLAQQAGALTRFVVQEVRDMNP